METKPTVERLNRSGYPTIVRENKPGAKYTTRIRFQGKVHFVTLAETADASFSQALAARREIQAGRWQALKQTVGLRSDCGTTLGEIKRAYLGDVEAGDAGYLPAPPKVLADGTKKKNVYALENMLRRAGVPPADTLPLATLTGELVYKYKQAVLKACKDEAPEAATRLCRSANSILIQARSIFADEARTYFERSAKIKLPATLDKFRTEPGFKQVAKTEYHAPSDVVVAKTFKHLEALGRADATEQERNEFVACWLALGFGLRASELAKARKQDFHEVAGDIAFRPPWFGKSKRKTLEVRAQLGAWNHLGPIVAKLPAGAYVLTGTDTERTGDVFRRISGWMKSLGWETTHHCHELRAYAGSYIADHPPVGADGQRMDGVRAAQIFLRHASYATTEKFYGHHRKQQLGKVALHVPQVGQPAAIEQPNNIIAL